MSAFRHLSALEIVPIWTGVIARRIEGRHVTFAVVELEPNSVVAEHRHPNEQIGMIVKGLLRFNVGGEIRELREGDTYVIPGGVPHEAAAGPQGAVAIDVFSPTREDWGRFTPEAPRPTLEWP